MPTATLSRKLDILSRASNTPKLLMDTLYVMVSEAEDRDAKLAALTRRVQELEGTVADPSREVRMAIATAESKLDSLKRDAQQVEHTIREAEASFSAQFEIKRMELEEAVTNLSCQSERLLQSEIPHSMSSQLRQTALSLKEITRAAIESTAHVIRTARDEAVNELSQIARHTCTASLDQMREEAQVISFAATKRLESDAAAAREAVQENAARATQAIHAQTQACATFVGHHVSDALHFAPLVDVHRYFGEVQLGAAQLNFLEDSVNERFRALSQELARYKKDAEAAQQKKQNPHDHFDDGDPVSLATCMKRLTGFLSLWGADEDVLQEMADLRGDSASPTSRVGQLKKEYLLSLPVFQHVLGQSARDSVKSPASTARPRIAIPTTPPPASPKVALLEEARVGTSSAAKRVGMDQTVPPVRIPPGDQKRSPKTTDGRREDGVVEVSVEAEVGELSTPLPLSSVIQTPTREHRKSASGTDRLNSGSGAVSVADVYKSFFGGSANDSVPADDPRNASASTIATNSTEGSLPRGSKSPTAVPSPEPIGLLITDSTLPSGGVIVSGIVPGSAAERAGVLADDHIMSVNGQMVVDRHHLVSLLKSKTTVDSTVAPGSSAKLTQQAELRLHVYRPSSGRMVLAKIKLL